MRRRFIFVLLAACAGLPASFASAAMSIDELMSGLAKRHEGHARFTETRYIAVLDKPLVSSGEVSFIAPDRLEKRTFKPKPEWVTLDGDSLRIERGQKKLSINLSAQPEALAFVASVRGTLTGNRVALESDYRLILDGEASRWLLIMLPSNPDIARIIHRVTVRGGNGQIREIEYLQADGDRIVMRFEAMDTP